VKQITDAAIAASKAVGAVPVGRVTADITTSWKSGSYVNGVFTSPTATDRDDRSRESTLGHLVADALLASLTPPDRGGAEITVVNPGGLRAEFLLGTDNGVITFEEANSVLPFANNLNTATLTGAQIKTLLEQQWQRNAQGAPVTPGYLQLSTSKNFTYTFDPSLPLDNRITSITINGAPVDPARTYRVGTFSFLLDGGDNFHVFRSATDKRDSGLIDRDAFVAYLQTNNPVSPDFARRAVQVTPAFPVTATPGQQLTFTVPDLDLRSLGSPQNTSLTVYVGGIQVASVPVVNGSATVNVTVPATLPTGSRNVVLVAEGTATIVNSRTLNAIAPARLFDTRGPRESPNVLRTVPTAKIGGENVLKVKATNLLHLVPSANVTAVSLNVAVTNPEADGFVTVYPC
jgi:5'-nucleotidase